MASYVILSLHRTAPDVGGAIKRRSKVLKGKRRRRDGERSLPTSLLPSFDQRLLMVQSFGRTSAHEALPGQTCWAEERSELLGSPFSPLENLSSKCDEEISSVSGDRSFLLHLICFQSAGGRTPGPGLHPDWTSTHVRNTGSVGSVPELN